MFTTQWVDSVTNSSSQRYGYSASNIVGKRKFYPKYGASETETWCPIEISNMNYHETIDLMFKKSMKIVEIEVYETQSCGCCVKILSKDPFGDWIPLYIGKKKCQTNSSQIFMPILKQKEYSTFEVRLEFDTSGNFSHVAIDAVQIKGYEAPIQKILHVEDFKEFSLDILKLFNQKETPDFLIKVLGGKKPPLTTTTTTTTPSTITNTGASITAGDNNGENAVVIPIYAHRTILAGASEFFRQLICSSNKQELSVDHSSPEIVELVLRYIYSGFLEVTVDNVNGVIKCSENFGLDALKSFCFDFIVESVDKDTVCDLLNKATRKEFDFDPRGLINSCLLFIDENCMDVVHSDRFILLEESILLQILQSQHLSVDEIDLFQAVIEWTKKNEASAKQLDKIFRLLRYPIMSAYELVFIVKPTNRCPIDLYVQAVEYHAKPSKFANNINETQFQPRGSVSIKGAKVMTNKWLKMIVAWIGSQAGREISLWELFYQGSRDGFEALKFHNLCNKKGPTITIVKSTTNCVFGGYNPESWASNGKYVQNSAIFLFSLQNPVLNTAGPLKFDYKGGSQFGAYCQSTYGPTFGGGHDLYIADKCNTVNYSYSNIGTSFIVPTNYDAKCILAGAYNFTVEEIEVYGMRQYDSLPS